MQTLQRVNPLGLGLWIRLPRVQCQCFCHKSRVGSRFMSNDLKSRSKLIDKNVSPPVKKTKPASASDVKKIRNIGIMAHIDAGKTTTTERMLYFSGLIRHMGSVDDGDTVTDYMDQERARGITITSAAITFTWKKYKINLIDTPGHVDFTVEVERALRVLDGVVVVIDAAAGVEAQTLTVWRQAQAYNIPALVFVNKMDKRGASFSASLASLRDSLGVTPLPLQRPLPTSAGFSGVLDLVSGETLRWRPGGEMEARGAEDATVADWTLARAELVETLADLDDTVADLVLSDVAPAEVPRAALVGAIRRACMERRVVPVLCGSALRNAGVQPLMDAVVSYLPSPADCPPHDFTQYYGDSLCALAFKIVHDRQRGALTYLRLYSGAMATAQAVYNASRGCAERGGRLLALYADEYTEITRAGPGDIIAVTGLKETVSGDTIVASARDMNRAKRLYLKSEAGAGTTEGQDDTESEEPVDAVLAGLRIPAPVFLRAVEPASMSQQRALDQALARLTREDPSLRVTVDGDTGQTVLAGMGELHLEVIFERLRSEFSVDADLGPVYIAYRERISAPVTGTHSLDRQLGETRHQVTVELMVEPRGDHGGRGDKVPLHVSPREQSVLRDRPLRPWHHKAVQHGITSAVSRGPLLSAPVVDLEVTLRDLEVGRGTSVAMVTACVAEAVEGLLPRAGPRLLEPVMDVTIHTPECYLGTVLKDLAQRRSVLGDVTPSQDVTASRDHTVTAVTPLAELLGYASHLRTATSGTASLSMELAHYRVMAAEHQQHAVNTATGLLW